MASGMDSAGSTLVSASFASFSLYPKVMRALSASPRDDSMEPTVRLPNIVSSLSRNSSNKRSAV